MYLSYEFFIIFHNFSVRNYSRCKDDEDEFWILED